MRGISEYKHGDVVCWEIRVEKLSGGHRVLETSLLSDVTDEVMQHLYSFQGYHTITIRKGYRQPA